MSDSKEKLFINGVNAYLENVNYSMKNNISNISKLELKQNIELIKCNEEVVVIRMTRSLNSDSHEFELTVSCVGEYYIDKKSIDNFKDIEDMTKYTKTRMSYLVDKIQMGSYISQIIANLTGNFGRNPIIIPSILNEDTVNNDLNN